MVAGSVIGGAVVVLILMIEGFARLYRRWARDGSPR